MNGRRVAASLAGALALFATRAARADGDVGKAAPPTARVEFRAQSDVPKLELIEITSVVHGRHGESYGYGKRCTEPCSLDLAPGERTLGVAAEGRLPRLLPPAIIPTAGGTVTGEYVSHADEQTAGLVLLVGGILGGSALVVTGVVAFGDDPSVPMMGSGIAVLLGGLVGGFAVLIGSADEARFTFVPAVTPVAGRWEEGDGRRLDASAAAPGATVGVRF